jgi:CubicO group peptidase (beta-lactamase class C family)
MLLGLSLAALACTAGTGRPNGRFESAGLETRVDDYLNAYARSGDFSGVMLIAEGSRILFRKAYGYADPARRTLNRPETVFRVASLSKTFTAAGISILIEQGKVGLSDPVSRYIRDFPNGDAISVKHLLVHSSGVGQVDAADAAGTCVSTDELVRRIAGTPPRFPPGTDDSYSNEGYVLLAAIIERASGEDYETFLQKSIFRPLGMNHTGVMCVEWPVAHHASGSIAGLGNDVAALSFEEPGLIGAGSVYSTVDDLLSWLRAVGSDELFGFSALEYPYGWGERDYSGRRLVEQTGQLEGHTAHMALYPGEQLSFIFLNNVQSGMTNRLPKDLEALVFGGTPSAPPQVKEVSTLKGEQLFEFEGTFLNATIPVPLRFVVKQERLWMQWGESPFFRPLMMTGRDAFFLRAEYAVLTFQRGNEGGATDVTYRVGDAEALTFARRHRQ